jgi:glycosyltransferase involved in cell wall biosynthesis
MRTFHEVYHPELALRVLAELRQSHPEATLTMAGQEKGLGARVEQLTEELGLCDAVRRPGFLGLERKQQEFNRHDIFLNTSRIDNMPVSVLEACAFGLPVVATRVGGIPDLLEHERTGLLVPDGDVGAMAAAVRRLVDEPALARRLSAGGRVLAELSRWEAVRPQWETLFNEVINARST